MYLIFKNFISTPHKSKYVTLLMLLGKGRFIMRTTRHRRNSELCAIKTVCKGHVNTITTVPLSVHSESIGGSTVNIHCCPYTHSSLSPVSNDMFLR
jgi:hypothetical protein